MLFKITGLGLLPQPRVVKQAVKEKDFEKHRGMKVHWAKSPTPSYNHSSTSSFVPTVPPPRPFASYVDIDPLYFYFALLFVLIRTPNRRDKIKRLMRLSVIDTPRQALQGSRAIALRLLVGKEKAKMLIKELKSSN